MKTANYVIICFFILALWITIIYGHVVVHEKIHQAIFTNYRMDSKVVNHLSLRNFDALEIIEGRLAYTMPLNNYANCNEECLAQHIHNEIQGYHSLNIIHSIFGFLLILLVIIHVNTPVKGGEE